MIKEQKVEDIIRDILAGLNVNDIIRGTPMDILAIDDKIIAVTLALHCCLNGPVGTNKETTFPTIGDGSIKSLLKLDVPNSSWRAFCSIVKKKIDAGIDCNQVRQNGDYWPI